MSCKTSNAPLPSSNIAPNHVQNLAVCMLHSMQLPGFVRQSLAASSKQNSSRRPLVWSTLQSSRARLFQTFFIVNCRLWQTVVFLRSYPTSFRFLCKTIIVKARSSASGKFSDYHFVIVEFIILDRYIVDQQCSSKLGACHSLVFFPSRD